MDFRAKFYELPEQPSYTYDPCFSEGIKCCNDNTLSNQIVMKVSESDACQDNFVLKLIPK